VNMILLYNYNATFIFVGIEKTSKSF